MSTTEFDTENIIAVTEADLRDEQKQAMAKAMEKYKQLCLKSFSIKRQGGPEARIADASADHV